MTKFRSFFEEALRLPYKSNSQDNPLHELQVQALLIKYGFEYEYQPNGLQQSPAVGRGISELIIYNKYMNLDLKSLSPIRLIEKRPFLERAII